jgi:glycosyltransferase involved in cell wall biosynthesis
VGDAPEIAVIIGAYRRREYLLRAVHSVLAQTLSRSRYEVFVTKDFADPVIDAELARLGVPNHVDADPRIGTWLARAVASTRAPLLTFLDDDDEYEPERLARVLAVFQEHPDVGFYRNRVRVIDAAGHPVAAALWRPLEVDAAFDASGPVRLPTRPEDAVVEFAFHRTRSTFNSSTMAVRRAQFEGPWADVFARTQLPDLALVVGAALGTRALFFDDRRLTRYRFYHGNVTHRVAWLAEAARSHREAGELSRARGNEALADHLAREGVHFERLYRSGVIVEGIGARAPRRTIARLSGEYLQFLGGHPRERALRLDVWAAEAYGLTYCLAPGVARRVRAARVPGHQAGG